MDPGPSNAARRSKASMQRRAHRRRWLWTVSLAAASLLSSAHAQSQPPARWAQASALKGSCFVVQGGHANPAQGGGGGYTYTSGPATSDMLALDLSKSFSADAAPWQNVTSSGPAPAVYSHSLSTLDERRLLAFGGQTSYGGSGADDSAYIAELSSDCSRVTWSEAPNSWDAPARRIAHATESDGKGNVWIFGGERPDGSSVDYNDAWTIDADTTNSSFSRIEARGAGLGATANRLRDGRIVLIGGEDSDGTLARMNRVAIFNTTSQTWTRQRVSGDAPTRRRGHSTVLLSGDRLLIFGGADALQQTALSDMWILDFSRSRPRWSQVESTGNMAPSARFGHSAVAYGDKVAIAFGWAGYNAADSQVHIFDASSLSIAADGTVSGGQWIDAYAPGSSVSSSGTAGDSSDGSSGGSSSGGSVSDGSTSDSSSGSGSSDTGRPSQGGAEGSNSNSDPSAGNGDADSSGSGDSSGDDGPTDEAGRPIVSPVGPLGSDDNLEDESTLGAGGTAGVVVGSFLGLTALVALAFYAYRRRMRSHDDWLDDGGKAGLLTEPKQMAHHMYDPDVEKGLYGTGMGAAGATGAAVAGSAIAGSAVAGPRPMPSQENTHPAWSASNMGQAFEGSGPHLGQRIALLAGFGRAPASTQSHRFNLLADEDDADPYAARSDDETHEPRQTLASVPRQWLGGSIERPNRTLQGSSSAAIEEYLQDNASSYGSVGTDSTDDEGDGRAGMAGLAALGGAAAMRSKRRRKSAPMSNTNSTNTLGDAPSSSDEMSGTNHEHRGIISFSDAPSPSRQRRLSGSVVSSGHNDDSPLIRRSGTWWNRFMTQSFLERTASGRLASGPSAEDPIRDPTEPPQLGIIRETSSATGGPSVGRRSTAGSTASSAAGHLKATNADRRDRSTASLQTASSSAFERRLRNMDVVQRAGTNSTHHSVSRDASIRTGSLGSEGALSRHSSARNPFAEGQDEQAMNVSPTSYLPSADQTRFTGAQIPTTVEENEEGESSMLLGYEEEAGDIGSQDLGFVHQQARQDSERYPRADDSDIEADSSSPQYGALPKRRNASEVPSITPSTTKRARQNPQMTSRMSPEARHRLQPPVQGNVADRVRDIERKWSEEGDQARVPLPRSPGSSAHSSTSSVSAGRNQGAQHTFSKEASNLAKAPERPRGARPLPTRVDSSQKTSDQSHSSGRQSQSSSQRVGGQQPSYSHGLAPKPQLFVANPDHAKAGLSTEKL